MNFSEESQSVPLVSIDTTDFYRTGAPNPLPALPLKSECVAQSSQEYQRFQAIQRDIVTGLRNSGIRSFDIEMVHRFVLGERATANNVTVLIVMERDLERDNLTVAVNEVLSHLFKGAVHNIRVEALDMRAHRHYFVPNLSKPFYVATWDRLQRDITAILGKTDYTWCSFTILNRGQSEPESEPAIVIGIRQSATFEWKTRIHSQVLDRLEKDDLDMDVVFVRETLLFAREVDEPDARSMIEFSGPVTVGSSVGIDDTGGTLGGYFTLEYEDGQRKVFGVTTHRAVFSDKAIEEAEKAGVSAMECSGVKKPDELPWKVHSPSLADKDEASRHYNYLIRGHRGQIDGRNSICMGIQEHHEGLKEQLERATRKGSDTTNLKTKLRYMEESLEDFINVRDALQNDMDLTFATVYATSGRGQFGERDGAGNLPAMDWALLDCLPSRHGDNTMPKSEKFNRRGGISLTSPPKPGRRPSFGGGLIPQATKFTRRPLYHQFFAYTRSGHKSANFSHIDAITHFYGDPNTYRALVFFNRHEAFMRPGDSGCWILNQFGHLEALGFAAGPETLVDYAIPIEDVYDDIQKKTGAKIVDPELWDTCWQRLPDDIDDR